MFDGPAEQRSQIINLHSRKNFFFGLEKIVVNFKMFNILNFRRILLKIKKYLIVFIIFQTKLLFVVYFPLLSDLTEVD